MYKEVQHIVQIGYDVDDFNKINEFNDFRYKVYSQTNVPSKPIQNFN